MSVDYSEADFDSNLDVNLKFAEGDIVVGDEVYIKSYDKIGKVISVGKNGEYEVALGSVKTKLKSKD